MRIIFRVEMLADKSGKVAERLFTTIKSEDNILKDINGIGNLSDYPTLTEAITDVKSVFMRLKKIKDPKSTAFSINKESRTFTVTFFGKKDTFQAQGIYEEGDTLDNGVTELVEHLLHLKRLQAKESNREMFKRKLKK